MNFLPDPNIMPISEETARRLIRERRCGYWEPFLRDSISKIPIAHPEAMVICVQGVWYLVTTEILKVVEHGYMDLAQTEEGMWEGHLAEIWIEETHPICQLILADIERT